MASKIGKILVVDDNLGIRRALEILLPVHFAEVKTGDAGLLPGTVPAGRGAAGHEFQYQHQYRQ